MKHLKRPLALFLAVMVFTITPVADYTRAREEAQAAAVVPAVPALAGAAKFIFDLLLTVMGVHMAGEMLGGLWTLSGIGCRLMAVILLSLAS